MKLSPVRRRPVLLELDLTAPVVEELPADPLGRLQARRRTVLHRLTRALAEAADDNAVGGLVARLSGRRMPLAQAEEVRDAVRLFASSGKPTVAWAETFGELAPATVAYFVASGFPEIWVQPSGSVGFVGLSAGALFLAEALERSGIEVEVDARHEYKNAPDMFTRRGFSEAHREAVARLVESSFEVVVQGVSETRGLTVERVRELAGNGPLDARAAREAGLVDRIGYRDEVYTDLRRRIGPDVALRFVSHYRPGRSLPHRVSRVVRLRRPHVAVLVGHGTIQTGRSGRSPLSGPAMGSDHVGSALRSAARDPRVAAVVFRVNSPGGSYVASDAIWREVVRCREAGKPVVVSMGDVAASGGYFVSAPADAIVAHPGTITGSIGVFAGKPVLSSLLNRLGVRHEAVTTGGAARMMSPLEPFTAEERARLGGWLDAVYDDFVGKVASGRRLSREQVHEIARGRVWSGADALARGLVDELGGLRRAVDLARARAGLDPAAPAVAYPKVSPIRRLRAPRSSEDAAAAFAVGPLGRSMAEQVLLLAPAPAAVMDPASWRSWLSPPG
jgi:protease-4